jgi:hypothetical protein
MSRQKKDRDLFPNGSISEEAILAYLQGGLSPEEKQQFEKLLADDPFAQEALDGLKTAQIATVTKSMASVKRQVREVSGASQPKLVKMHWSSYAWAAAVFGLLIGIGFLMVGYLGNKSENLAQNTEKVMDTETQLLESEPQGAKLESAAPVTDSMTTGLTTAEGTDLPLATEPAKEGETEQFFVKKPEAGTANGTVAATNQKNDKAVPVVTSPAVTDKKVALTNEPSAATYKAEEKNKQSIAQEQKVAEDANLERMAVSGKKGEKQKPKSTGTAVTMKDMNTAAQNSSADIETAMKNFNDGNYDVSSDQFSTVLKNDPGNADALYFGGISDYITNKNAKGEKNFDKLLKSGNRYSEGSKWYKANILLQKGKKEDAKKLLNDLSNTNSSYRERAIKKMAEMEF